MQRALERTREASSSPFEQEYTSGPKQEPAKLHRLLKGAEAKLKPPKWAALLTLLWDLMTACATPSPADVRVAFNWQVIVSLARLRVEACAHDDLKTLA